MPRPGLGLVEVPCRRVDLGDPASTLLSRAEDLWLTFVYDWEQILAPDADGPIYQARPQRSPTRVVCKKNPG